MAARPAPDADAASDAVLNNAIEVTWLHHDIAKCYLALQAASPKDASLQQKVEQHAQQAFDWATKATQIVAVPGVPLSRLIQEDKAAAEAYRWLLFAIVVKAQAMEKKGGAAKEAKDEYQTALELAKNMEDTSASEAIQAALSAVNV